MRFPLAGAFRSKGSNSTLGFAVSLSQAGDPAESNGCFSETPLLKYGEETGHSADPPGTRKV